MDVNRFLVLVVKVARVRTAFASRIHSVARLNGTVFVQINAEMIANRTADLLLHRCVETECATSMKTAVYVQQIAVVVQKPSRV